MNTLDDDLIKPEDEYMLNEELRSNVSVFIRWARIVAISIIIIAGMLMLLMMSSYVLSSVSTSSRGMGEHIASFIFVVLLGILIYTSTILLKAVNSSSEALRLSSGVEAKYAIEYLGKAFRNWGLILVIIASLFLLGFIINFATS
ncbi:MAG: hypothetical protein HWE14_02735 [Flavobacteriia bacterium]|nr:hypothetical protein [Flavobacteriia bacterium]